MVCRAVDTFILFGYLKDLMSLQLFTFSSTHASEVLSDPVYARENGTVPCGTVLLGTEQFHASCVNAKRFQMVPELITRGGGEECVLNHKNPVFFSTLKPIMKGGVRISGGGGLTNFQNI